MTVVRDIPERDWNAGTARQSFTTTAAAALFTVTFTHPEWPEGTVLGARISWNGAPFAEFSCSGGVRFNKDGSAKPAAQLTQTTCTLFKPAGVTDLEVVIRAVQPLRSAVTVERL